MMWDDDGDEDDDDEATVRLHILSWPLGKVSDKKKRKKELL